MLIHDQRIIFDHLVPCILGFDSSTTSDMMDHSPGWASGQNLGNLRFFFYNGIVSI